MLQSLTLKQFNKIIIDQGILLSLILRPVCYIFFQSHRIQFSVINCFIVWHAKRLDLNSIELLSKKKS
jgi:hypothetical protein